MLYLLGIYARHGCWRHSQLASSQTESASTSDRAEVADHLCLNRLSLGKSLDPLGGLGHDTSVTLIPALTALARCLNKHSSLTCALQRPPTIRLRNHLLAALPMPQKRRRAEFEGDFDEFKICDLDIEQSKLRPHSSSVPQAKLTSENLHLHTLLQDTDRSLQDTDRSPTMAAGSSAPSTAADYDDETSLTKYGVVLDSNEEPPPELLRHLSALHTGRGADIERGQHHFGYVRTMAHRPIQDCAGRASGRSLASCSRRCRCAKLAARSFPTRRHQANCCRHVTLVPCLQHTERSVVLPLVQQR